MKAVSRISSILKVAGIVLILVSLVLGLYALLNTGKGWGAMNQEMIRYNTGTTGFLEKLRFDDGYLSALSAAAADGRSTEERMEAARPKLERWFGAAEKSMADEEARIQRETLRWLDEDFDQAAFRERLEAMEDLQESQELREFFEYINGLATPPKKGGKVAALQAASQEPFLKETYEAYAAEHGEAAGSWYEYVASVHTMLKEEEASGSKVRDLKGWMASSFTPEAYAKALEKVRTAESKEATDTFIGLLETALDRKLSGADAGFDSMLDNAVQTLAARYPGKNFGGNVSEKTALCLVLPELLSDEQFDGSWGAVSDALLARAKADSTPGVKAWEEQYLNEHVIKEADNRASIAVIAPFWAVTAKYATILLAGILLLILSRLIRWLMNKRLLATRETAGIDEDPDILLRVEHLKQYFRSGPAVTKAVDDVSFFIRKGEVFGLVGESGCGKTTTGRTIINLYDPTEGNVYFDGLKISTTQNGLPTLKAQLRQDYGEKIREAQKKGNADEVRQLKAERRAKLSEAERNALESSVEKSKCVEYYRAKRLKELKEEYDRDMQTLTGSAAEERKRKYETERKVAAKDNVMTRMQMIFQDPIASINPRMTVREIIAEGLIIRGVKDREYINRKVNEMLELVGLVPEHADRYPHEFSGGQRQRIGIARAIIMEPSLIIADEPISALDVSIQAQVINLLNDLRERMGLTIMFIAHNLSVVKYFSDRIAVMYYGHIVELATSDELFAHPLHPYTKSLLSAIPYPDPHYEKARTRIEYVPAKAHDYSEQQPTLREISPGHWILCNDAEYQQYLKEIKK